jgi:Ca2+/Na+ antiporter
MDTLFKTGIEITQEVKFGGIIVIVTSIPFFLIQVPGMFIHGPLEEVAQGEKYWALAGLCVCLIGFVSYLYYQFEKSGQGVARMKRVEATKKQLLKGKVSLAGALYDTVKKTSAATSSGGYQSMNASSGIPEKVKDYLKDVLHEPFNTYDADQNGTLEKKEFNFFLRDFHESISDDRVDEIYSSVDSDGDGIISFDEFIDACYKMILWSGDMDHEGGGRKMSDENKNMLVQGFFAQDENEEAEDLPPDISELSPEQQQSAIKKRAFLMLTLGTTLAVIFSDPLVGVLDEMASRMGISPFYVAFVLAPWGSNASEVIASQYYAAKKTRKSITVSLTALEGAGAMSNTFCLSIFMGLVFFRKLAWSYTAETISIVAVEYALAIMVQRNKLSTFQGFVILMFYPLSLVFVATLEHLGID